VPGSIVFAAAGAWYLVRLGPHPDFLGEWLPGSLMIGIGLGLAYSTLTSAAVVELTGRRFAIGSAVNAMTRQLGAVLGVALAVAVVGTPAPRDAIAAFDRAWILTIAAAVAGAAACLTLGRTRVAGASHRRV